MDIDATNPLLSDTLFVPFDKIEAEHVAPAMDLLLTRAKAAMQAIKDVEGPRTWANTMAPLDEATEPLERAFHAVGHLHGVCHTDALDAAYAEVTPAVMGFYTSISMDSELFAAVRDFALTDEAAALTGARARFVSKTLSDFKREGADLPDEIKARFRELSGELASVTQRFAQNVLKSSDAWSLHVEDESALAGLPPHIVDFTRATATADGLDGWVFKLQAHVIMAVLRYADDAGLRETLWRAYHRRGTTEPYDNATIIPEILALRAEQASLLGHGDFADYVLEDRMAGKGAEAVAFVRDLEQKARPAFDAEAVELGAYRQKLEGRSDLQPWDLSYYAEKQRRDEYNFDAEALRPYFPVDKVFEGLFELVRRLYGITIDETQEIPTWHESVRTFHVRDAEGTWIGSFYSDMFPRDAKRDGAWMSGFTTGCRGQRGFSPHVGGICANLTPPVDGRPALLTHREVETVFHEFGHLLHHLLTSVEVRSLAGTNVAWDFVELPSQIMENWCWKREALDLIAGHWETGERIPDELFEAMTRARRFRAATAMIRQLGFASIDLKLHTQFEPSRDGDVIAYARDEAQRFSPAVYPADYSMITAFGHLFSGAVAYAAGYYSYLWAAVLDADAFTLFEERGIFDATTGDAFRDAVLARGASEAPEALYKRFMGRGPDPDALLRRQGLLPDVGQPTATA